MRSTERIMKDLKYLQTSILTTVALLLAMPASAAVLEGAHSRTELDLPPAVAEAIRETGGAAGDHVATAAERPIKVATRRLQAQEVPATVGPSTAAPTSSGASVSAGEGTAPAAADAPSDSAPMASTEDSLEDDYAMTELLATERYGLLGPTRWVALFR
jgi:hypothetical protein